MIIDMKGRGRTAFWQAYEGLRAASTTLVLPGSLFHLTEFSAFQPWALLDVKFRYSLFVLSLCPPFLLCIFHFLVSSKGLLLSNLQLRITVLEKKI